MFPCSVFLHGVSSFGLRRTSSDSTRANNEPWCLPIAAPHTFRPESLSYSSLLFISCSNFVLQSYRMLCCAFTVMLQMRCRTERRVFARRKGTKGQDSCMIGEEEEKNSNDKADEGASLGQSSR